MLTFIVIYIVLAIILLLVFRKTIRYKLMADRKGVPISWGQVIGQTTRKTLSYDILEAASLAKKEKLKIEIHQFETHKLASGDPLRVVKHLIEAKKKGKRLSFNEAAAMDLAGSFEKR